MSEASLPNLGIVEVFHHVSWNVCPISATAPLSKQSILRFREKNNEDVFLRTEVC